MLGGPGISIARERASKPKVKHLQYYNVLGYGLTLSSIDHLFEERC